MIRGVRVAVVATVLGCLVGLVPAVPVDASPFYWRTGGIGCTFGANSADSRTHNINYDASLSATMQLATGWARTNVVDPTVIDTFLIPSPPPWDTDVVIFDADYVNFCSQTWHSLANPNGVAGFAHCVLLATNPANACEQFEVRYDESFVFAPNQTTAWRRGLACHELGHTLGLGHVAVPSLASCMFESYPKPLLNYSTHEINDHINWSY